MKTRNPNATCGNCPYWESFKTEKVPGCYDGLCHADNRGQGSNEEYWCRHHPDFWQAETTDLAVIQNSGVFDGVDVDKFNAVIDEHRYGLHVENENLRAAMEGLCEAAAASAYNLKIALDAAKEAMK